MSAEPTPKDVPQVPDPRTGRKVGTGQGSGSALDAMLRKRREGDNSGMGELPESPLVEGLTTQ